MHRNLVKVGKPEVKPPGLVDERVFRSTARWLPRALRCSAPAEAGKAILG
jgi:hypothetical protein